MFNATRALLAGAIVLTAAPAVAQQGGDQPLPRTELVASLDARFKAIDTNNDGHFTKAEFLTARTKAEQTQLAQVKQLLARQFAALDANKDGSVTEAELGPKLKNPAAAKTGIADLDKNKDGKLSSAEFSAQVSRVEATADPDQQIARWDGDRNNQVSLAEYKNSALAQFDALDGNKDGTLTIQEAQAASASKGR